jgi:hypothetical protein
MSDLSFDAVSHSDAGSSAEDAGMTEHPVLFFRDDMVTISVSALCFQTMLVLKVTSRSRRRCSASRTSF